MTNKEILASAMRQSAIDINCAPEDFQKGEHAVVEAKLGAKARAYYQEPIACNLVSYGNNIVASVKKEYRETVEEYIKKFPWYHCFETPNLHWLNERMQASGQKVCFMAEYFLPDVDRLAKRECGYELRLLGPRDFEGLYLPQWSNALCERRKALDVLGVGAYDGEKLVGFAGCSADCDSMWQIGVDVLPEYRRQGIASVLTGNLAIEILKREKVPFYCCAWSNIPSARNAVRSGFVPSWVELTVKPAELVDSMNR